MRSNLYQFALHIYRNHITLILFVVLIGVGIAGYWVYGDEGFSQRLIRTKTGLLAYSGMKNSSNEANRNCPLSIPLSNAFEINCIAHLNPKASKIVVVWGDSHAQSWLPVFEAIAQENDVQLYVLAHHGCPPLQGVRRADGLTALPCSTIHSMDPIIEDITRIQPQVVVLVSRWSLYANGWIKEGRLQEASHFLTTNERGLATQETSRVALKQKTPNIINRLHGAGIKVLVIQNPPVLHFDVFNPRKTKEQIQVTRIEHQQQNQFIDQIFSGLNHAYFYDSSKKLCQDSQSQCITEQGGKVLYRDDNHLSKDGALWFMGDIQKMLKTLQVLP
jgi:hypothetical protein